MIHLWDKEKHGHGNSISMDGSIILKAGIEIQIPKMNDH